jgi:hypothetical protein
MVYLTVLRAAQAKYVHKVYNCVTVNNDVGGHERSVSALVWCVWGKSRNPLRLIGALTEIRNSGLTAWALSRRNTVFKHCFLVRSRSECVCCLASNPALPPDVFMFIDGGFGGRVAACRVEANAIAVKHVQSCMASWFSAELLASSLIGVAELSRSV